MSIIIFVVLICVAIFLWYWARDTTVRGRYEGGDINKSHILFLLNSKSYGGLPKEFPEAKIWKPSPLPKTAEQLHEFAGNHSVAAPFTIVAEGNHAATAIDYQRDHTLEVRGMVLINPPSNAGGDTILPENVITHTKQVGLGAERRFPHLCKDIDRNSIAASISNFI